MRKPAIAFLSLAVLLSSFAAAHASSPGKVSHDFASDPDGATPMARMIADKSGNLYGTTEYGGDSVHCGFGCGTIFKIAPDGTESVLHTFEGSDGFNPMGGLALDKAGNLYGTTYNGGPLSAGVVFKLTPDGTYTLLYSFGTDRSDGGHPLASLVIDKAGNLYGTNSVGGVQSGGGTGGGTIFKVAPDGTETVLYVFPFFNGPVASDLIIDQAGTLFGTTPCGSLSGSGFGCTLGLGTVFKLASDGTYSTLYEFTGDTDGARPSGLVADNAGNLYGTAVTGAVKNKGCSYGYCGTIFKISAGGAFSAIYQFLGGSDGSYPAGTMVLDDQGNLYGVTSHGGGAGAHLGSGTVFKLALDGTKTTLLEFGGHHGAVPVGGLIADKGFKHLYGVTSEGSGKSTFGVVFTVKP